MDNLCHTLVGAALGEAGLRKRTPLAMAALVIAANAPDVDGILYWLNRPVAALGFRRGWTHGVLAMAVWPWVVAGVLLAWDRWVRRRGHPERAPAVPRELVLVSLLGVLTHPLLDLLNTYGVRLLMPFSGHWFYGDTLFIADPWMWLVLGIGWLVAWQRRRRGSPRPERAARAALAVATAYVLAMALSNVSARQIVLRATYADGGPRAERLMVAPLPVNPFRRAVVIQRDGGYEIGTFRWLKEPHYQPGRIVMRETGLPAPAVRAYAADTRAGRIFLDWARFPVFDVVQAGTGYEVLVVDARYTLSSRARFGAVAIPVPGTVSSPPGAHPIQESP